MKTRKPLIITAHIAAPDLEPFNQLRAAHFPDKRNFLPAHLTMFYRLPGEYEATIQTTLHAACLAPGKMSAEISGVRHLGTGVAFSIDSPELQDIREKLKSMFLPWLGSQDLRKWQPHITVQNKVGTASADTLYRELTDEFSPRSVEVEGLQLWEYLDGPWRHIRDFAFAGTV